MLINHFVIIMDFGCKGIGNNATIKAKGVEKFQCHVTLFKSLKKNKFDGSVIRGGKMIKKPPEAPYKP